MEVWIDADGCPVVDETVRLCRARGVPCYIVCDTSHSIERPGAVTLIVSRGADSADFALVNRIRPGDLVVTQDYGLAAMCLARRARALNQNGLLYSEENMDALLTVRAANRKIRAAGGRIRGPHKRTGAQDAAFRQALASLLPERKETV